MSYVDFYLLTLHCLKFTVSYINFYLLIAYCLTFIFIQAGQNTLLRFEAIEILLRF